MSNPDPVLSIAVHDRDNPTIPTSAELVRFRNVEARAALRDLGTGRITLQNDDPQLAGIVVGQSMLRFRLDGVPVLQVLVEHSGVAEVSAGEEAQQATVLSGRDTRALLEESVVYPERGVEVEPWSDTRRFDFTSRDLDESAWTAAENIKLQGAAGAPYEAAPTSWPDALAYWIWADPATSPQPVGTCYFRKFFSVNTETPVRIFITADDGFQLFLDGVELIAEERAYLWRETRYVDVFLTIDEHLLAIKATNIDRPSNPSTNIAGVVLTMIELAEGGATLGNVIVNTDDTWLALSYPAVPAGFTIGRLLRVLYDEARSHATLTDVSLTFTDSLDSAGTSWPTAPELAFSVGKSLLSVLMELIEGGYCDSLFSSSAHQWSAWVSRGVASGVSLIKGDVATAATANLLELTYDVTA